MKIKFYIIITVTTCIFLASAWPNVYAKQREILIYTSNSGIQLMLDKSAKIWTKQTDVKVIWVCPGGSGAVVQKVIQEKKNPQADIAIASIPPMLSAKEAGALRKYVPQEAADIPSAFKDAEGYYTGWFAFYNCFIYNPDFVLKPPKTLNDLLNPAYKGKIMYPDPRTSGDGIRFLAMLVAIMGEDQAFQYLKKLEKNVIAHPSLVQGSLVDRGEIWIAVTDSSQSLTEYFKEGLTKQVMLFTEEGTIAGYVAIALIENGPNSKDAMSFLNFLTSKDAQSFVATEGYGIPTRKGVELPQNLKGAFQPAFNAKVLKIDWSWMKENTNHWIDRWVKEVLGSS